MSLVPLHSTSSVGLVEVIDRLLDKGLVINADIQVSLVGTELLGIRLRAALASFETAARYGLEFPCGMQVMQSPGWRTAQIGSESCPACGKRSATEELLSQGCPWCGWRSARARPCHLPSSTGAGPGGGEGVLPASEIVAMVTGRYDSALEKGAKTHLNVLEAARRRFGTVLPVAVGRLVGRGSGDPPQVIRQWLKENAVYLRDRLERLAGKDEYGLKVMWDPETVAARLAETSPELRRLKGEMAAAGSGQVYLLQERFRVPNRSHTLGRVTGESPPEITGRTGSKSPQA